ncbi:MAG: Pyridoxamine 5'-phosphate oxidase [Rhodanobacteraceae bacterium]|jgi:pyridoxamine 5'-phosphate oxidase|nr:MAG: Pyridoxamine 5'-phosphate oxidase [Rhodanobacteraceae bacterium]
MLSPSILETLKRLHAAALASDDPEPNAMNVVTADPDGRVHSRMVLLKTLDERGPTFFTDYDGDKGRQLAANPRVALCLHWKHVEPAAQVRIEGRAEKLPPEESDAYFATRPRLSQLGAWASLQSQTLPDRATLEQRVAEVDRQFAERPVPRPAKWGGYLVVPDMVEFWYAHEHRLNERHRWELVDGMWRERLLYP